MDCSLQKFKMPLVNQPTCSALTNDSTTPPWIANAGAVGSPGAHRAGEGEEKEGEMEESGYFFQGIQSWRVFSHEGMTQSPPIHGNPSSQRLSPQ